MKKYLFTTLMMVCGIIAQAQDYSFPKNEDGKYELSEVINNNLSKSTLFANSTSWAMEYFKEEGFQNVVQFCSETDGRIIIKNYGVVLNDIEIKKGKSHFGKENVNYTLTIDCKENKYRYIINDITIKKLSYSSLYGNDMEWDMTHERHLENITAYNHEKDSLNSLVPNLKGKKLTKIQNQISEVEDKIKGEKEMYNDEFAIFERLINSLKKKMLANTDF